jgi:class 3 adenylate cyclase
MITASSEAGIIQFTALGETVNVAAQLSTLAASGELLVSESAYRAAEPDLFAEPRTVRPKGHQPIEVRVFRSSADPVPQTV